MFLCESPSPLPLCGEGFDVGDGLMAGGRFYAIESETA